MGFFITRKILPYTVGQPVGITLISDIHIGAANIDYAALEYDLVTAKEAGDRILINGDIFDAILPKDHKRYRPDALDERLQRRADVLDGALDLATDYLAPYAKQIDMVGLGNHESAVEKYHATDMIARLIRRLNRSGGTVQYGGYTGFIDYRFRADRSNTKNRFIIYYHHGSGGQSPVTKGMIDFNRKAAWVDSDIVWMGHKHNKLVDATPMRMRCPKEGDTPTLDHQVFIMTGGYMDAYGGQTSESAMKEGRRTNYSSDWGLPPQAKGGIRLLVKFHRKTGIERIHTVS
jgi:hypothetical protein